MSAGNRSWWPLGYRPAAYLLLTVVTGAILFAGLRLDRIDLSAPFTYETDALLILPMVKATVETGTHWHTDRLGAPGIQELYDFPVVDHWHFAIVWLIGRAAGEAVVAFNLYYLLTYPLTALTAAVVLRSLGTSAPAAGAGAIIYAFLPYHTLRGEDHYFLSAYYLVPFSVMILLWVCQGRLPFFRGDAGTGYRFSLRTRDTAAATFVAIAVSSAGAYYAFFTCALLVPAGAYGWVVTRTWKAAASAGGVIAVLTAGGLANHIPKFVYQHQYGANPAYVRSPAEAEHHGLKLAQLLLPVRDHQSRWFAGLHAAYATPDRPLQYENQSGTLGLVGAAGLLGLLAAAVLPGRRSWPAGPLVGLTLFAVLLGTIGGLGAVFNVVVTPEVRAYNRVSVFIAFFAITFVVWTLDQAVRHRAAKYLVFLLITLLAVWDQSPRPWFRSDAAAAREHAAARFHADAKFFGRVEQSMPGGAVLTLPYVRYPEDYDTPLPGGYEHVRGYLHTRTVRWSFGAMRRREADQWVRETSAASPPDMLARLAIQGFDGVFIDRRGYTPAAADALVAAVLTAAGPDAPILRHADGNQLVIDLRPYRDRLRHQLGPEFDARRQADIEAVRVLWLSGFDDDDLGPSGNHRKCGTRGEVIFVNPTDRPRPLKLAMTFGTEGRDWSDLKIDGGVWSDRFPVSRVAVAKEWHVVIPPGRHPVAFRCRPPAGDAATDPGRLGFFIAQFQMTETP